MYANVEGGQAWRNDIMSIILFNQDIVTGGSALNIKAESLRLGNFSKDEIRELYLQHTSDTGQHHCLGNVIYRAKYYLSAERAFAYCSALRSGFMG